MAEIRIGTSAFAAAGWAGSFYPKWMKSTEYLSFYATPALSTVKNWYAKTPPGFRERYVNRILRKKVARTQELWVRRSTTMEKVTP